MIESQRDNRLHCIISAWNYKNFEGYAHCAHVFASCCKRRGLLPGYSVSSMRLISSWSFADVCLFCRLFTRFTLSTTSHQHVRIRSTELVPDEDVEGVKITSAAVRKPNIVVCITWISKLVQINMIQDNHTCSSGKVPFPIGYFEEFK